MSGRLVVAVESSGPRSAVALLRGGELLAEEEFVRGAAGRGSGSPAAAADRALRTAGLAPADVELVAASVGPGSYTGLRIGVSFAKCFAWALGLPAAAVPSLLALARELPPGGAGGPCLLVPTANAFRGQVFARALRRSPVGALEALGGDEVMAPGRLPIWLAGLRAPAEPVILFGSGAERYGEDIRAGLESAGVAAELPAGPACPSAATVGRIGAELANSGMTVTAHDLAPVYLRKTEAEERLETGPTR